MATSTMMTVAVTRPCLIPKYTEDSHITTKYKLSGRSRRPTPTILHLLVALDKLPGTEGLVGPQRWVLSQQVKRCIWGPDTWGKYRVILRIPYLKLTFILMRELFSLWIQGTLISCKSRRPLLGPQISNPNPKEKLKERKTRHHTLPIHTMKGSVLKVFVVVFGKRRYCATHIF